MSVPNGVDPDTGEVLIHPAGRSAGRRNAGCLSRAAGGPGLGNGGVTPPLTTWQPRYHLIDAKPNRTGSARSTFRSLIDELLVRGLLSTDAHALYAVLINASNTHAHAVWKLRVVDLAATLGWCVRKVTSARAELVELGLIEFDNRKGESSAGIRQRSNRYGFTWSTELCEAAGRNDYWLRKNCGAPELVFNKSERTRRARELRHRAQLSAQAQAERGRALQFVDDLLSTDDHADYQHLVAAIEERFIGDPEITIFVLDYLEVQWPKYNAGRFGRQLAGLRSRGMSIASMELEIAKRYGDRPDLAEIARAAVDLIRRE